MAANVPIAKEKGTNLNSAPVRFRETAANAPSPASIATGKNVGNSASAAAMLRTTWGRDYNDRIAALR